MCRGDREDQGVEVSKNKAGLVRSEATGTEVLSVRQPAQGHDHLGSDLKEPCVLSKGMQTLYSVR